MLENSLLNNFMLFICLKDLMMASQLDLLHAIQDLRQTETSYRSMKDDQSLPGTFHGAIRSSNLAIQALEELRYNLSDVCDDNSCGPTESITTMLAECGQNSKSLMETVGTLVTQQSTSRLEDYRELVRAGDREPVEILTLKILASVFKAGNRLHHQSEMQRLLPLLNNAIDRLSRLEASAHPSDPVSNSHGAGKDSYHFTSWGGMQNNNTGLGTQNIAGQDVIFQK